MSYMSWSTTKSLSVLSRSSEDCSNQRQSALLRDLELLLDLKPCALRSNLLGLPEEIRRQILDHVIPQTPERAEPELHTCYWGADMLEHDPWNHDTFGYAPSVPRNLRLDPRMLLINRQLHDEILQAFFRRSRITLHAEIRNSVEDNTKFTSSPHVLQLSMLQHVTNVRFYVEWNYTFSKHNPPRQAHINMTENLVRQMGMLLSSVERLSQVHLSILFFWRYRSGRTYQLSMQDLFELEDVFKQHAEKRWLKLLLGQETRDSRNSDTSVQGLSSSAGVGYKLLSTENKGTEQSGAMEVFIAKDVEDAMVDRRKSTIDFYGNFNIDEALPQPSYRHGGMI
ncbi:hypothetical protein M011DRAFT_491219 [Sporormia fimetaria CBS 119925]|uniref:F-box domain-containing protein n=1 Tax=Sporormia fimetaria CBS 119925 TaxID=1340428 RepID=A0A6A6VPC9_9PLEO|nr:hypothetical protein M011DRAFT_491219 [Sporormia fimetaria CBS 119925]